jgi:predicted Zn-dependent protease
VAQSTDTGAGFGQSWKRSLAELGVVLAVLVGLFFAGRAAIGCVATAAVSALPASVDAKIGTLGAEQFRAQYSAAGAPTEAEAERVQRIFDELRAGLKEDERAIVADARVTVVKDDTVNAFALPGGEVFVLTGLLDRAGDDDAMIRGVLAHELGHAIRRHGMRGLARRAGYAVALAYLLGDVDEIIIILGGYAAQIDSLSYSRDMESEADAFGVDLLQRTGHDPDGLARFLESLGSQPVPELLSTHPDPVERARAIREGQGR